MHTHSTEGLDQLIAAARQVVQTEHDLAGPALPVGLRPLPEIPPAVPAQPAPPGASAAGAALFAPGHDAVGLGKVPPEQKAAALDEIDRIEVKPCRKCDLWRGRTQTVFADGSPNAALMFIGEGPGADEDAQGLPFVGRAGQKLNEMIAAMGLARQDVYICQRRQVPPAGQPHPPAGRGGGLLGYLRRQIEIIHPKVIVMLGNPAARALLATVEGITRLRGHWQQYAGIPVMPTFHPAYLLRNYSLDTRRKVWNDLQMVMEKLGLKKK